jgi:hypothetical protein
MAPVRLDVRLEFEDVFDLTSEESGKWLTNSWKREIKSSDRNEPICFAYRHEGLTIGI